MSCVRPIRTLNCPLGPIGQHSSTAGGCESTFRLGPQVLRLRPGTPANAFGQPPIVVHFRGHGTTISLWTGAAYPVASGPLGFPGSSAFRTDEVIAGMLRSSHGRVLV